MIRIDIKVNIQPVVMPVVCIERPAKILKDGSSTIVQRSVSSQSLGGQWQQSFCIYRFVIVVAVETLRM